MSSFPRAVDARRRSIGAPSVRNLGVGIGPDDVGRIIEAGWIRPAFQPIVTSIRLA